MKYLASFIIGALWVFSLDAVSQEIQYCENVRTGEIIMIKNGKFCPRGYWPL